MSDTLSMPRRGFLRHGLTGTTLKLMALVLMLLDHIHYFFEFTVPSRCGFPRRGGSQPPCFYSVPWKGLPIPMTGGAISGASGLFLPGWGCSCS